MRNTSFRPNTGVKTWRKNRGSGTNRTAEASTSCHCERMRGGSSVSALPRKSQPFFTKKSVAGREGFGEGAAVKKDVMQTMAKMLIKMLKSDGQTTFHAARSAMLRFSRSAALPLRTIRGPPVSCFGAPLEERVASGSLASDMPMSSTPAESRFAEPAEARAAAWASFSAQMAVPRGPNSRPRKAARPRKPAAPPKYQCASLFSLVGGNVASNPTMACKAMKRNPGRKRPSEKTAAARVGQKPLKAKIEP
mmetsp:Transcript_24738/g.93567  ORF Transcript_24738/g.93567 Transcript_24738/m.93567 type:complete len:250 (-) Transcript_24738:742-1491(-)